MSQRFDLISRLGTGSMSKVWRAVDRKSGHVVALKVLDLDENGPLRSPASPTA